MHLSSEHAAVLPVEQLRADGQLLAILVRADTDPPVTQFITEPHQTLQAGFICYPAGGQVEPHVHRALERHIVGTGEVLVVRKGRMSGRFYDDRRTLVAEREFAQGDVIVLISGGHGFRMIEDTVLLEVKQGPYTGLDEKERFRE